jgi:hypothetical protein
VGAEILASALAGLASGGGGSSDPDDDVGIPPFGASLPPLDEERAWNALGSVDLSSCRVYGAPRGEGRAHVWFRSDGAVTQVEILAPHGLTDAARECIVARLSDAEAPPFGGAPTDVWAEFHVP